MSDYAVGFVAFPATLVALWLLIFIAGRLLELAVRVGTRVRFRRVSGRREAIGAFAFSGKRVASVSRGNAAVIFVWGRDAEAFSWGRERLAVRLSLDDVRNGRVFPSEDDET